MSIFDKELPMIFRNQLNGKSAQETYIEFKRQQQKELFPELEQELRDKIEKTIQDILSTLNI